MYKMNMARGGTEHQMDVVELNSASAEEFIFREPVSVILYFTPQDRGIHDILARLSVVARSFDANIGFGRVNVTESENNELRKEGVVVLTPALIYYRFGMPTGEDVGLDEIDKWLTHDWIVNKYGHTDTRLRLLR